MPRPHALSNQALFIVPMQDKKEEDIFLQRLRSCPELVVFENLIVGAVCTK